MYTTNAVEIIHSSFRKITKKGAFPNENTLLKVLYLRVKELETKWKGGYIQKWSIVMNQLLLHENLKERAFKIHGVSLYLHTLFDKSKKTIKSSNLYQKK